MKLKAPTSVSALFQNHFIYFCLVYCVICCFYLFVVSFGAFPSALFFAPQHLRSVSDRSATEAIVIFLFIIFFIIVILILNLSNNN